MIDRSTRTDQRDSANGRTRLTLSEATPDRDHARSSADGPLSSPALSEAPSALSGDRRPTHPVRPGELVVRDDARGIYVAVTPPSRRILSPACDRCTQGVMDAANDHRTGLCRCDCHPENLPTINGDPIYPDGTVGVAGGHPAPCNHPLYCAVDELGDPEAAFLGVVCIRGRCPACRQTVNLADHECPAIAPMTELERRAQDGDR